MVRMWRLAQGPALFETHDPDGTTKPALNEGSAMTRRAFASTDAANFMVSSNGGQSVGPICSNVRCSVSGVEAKSLTCFVISGFDTRGHPKISTKKRLAAHRVGAVVLRVAAKTIYMSSYVLQFNM